MNFTMWDETDHSTLAVHYQRTGKDVSTDGFPLLYPFSPFLYKFFFIFNCNTASANMHHTSAVATFHIDGNPNTNERKGNSDLDID